MPELTKTSKFISLVLRHNPKAANLSLDFRGWANVDALLEGARAQGLPISKTFLDQVVAENNKSRFEYSPDKLKIRARQGHSIKVDLGYEPVAPPKLLYHSSATRFIKSIQESGLLKGDRHAVHLSADSGTDTGKRHGIPVLLTVRAEELAETGALFYHTDNDVWLTDNVPVRYLDGI